MKSPRSESSSSPIGVSREMRLFRDIFHALDARDRPTKLLGYIFVGGFAAELLHELPGLADNLVDLFDHVDRNTYCPSLVGYGTCDSLSYPPCCVGGKLIAFTILEILHGLDKADIPFLNQIEKVKPAVCIFFCDGNDQAKIGFYQSIFRIFHHYSAAVNLLCHGDDRIGVGFEHGLELAHLLFSDLYLADLSP